MIQRKIFFIGLSILFILCNSIFATTTAFWRPYKLKPAKDFYPYGIKGPFWGDYGLFLLQKPDFSDYTGLISGVEKIGEVSWSPDGKFGGCAVFNGKGAIKYTASEPYPSNPNPGTWMSVEAWINVKKYPQDKGYILYKAPVIQSGELNQQDEVGVALYIDSKGKLNFSTTHTSPNETITVSSPVGVIPLNKWIWVAAIYDGNITLYINGNTITEKEQVPGLGANVIKPGPIYIGNNAELSEGFIGKIDQVRIDTNVYKFWPRENLFWTFQNNKRKIPTGPPYFLKNNEPVFYLPLDGNFTPAINKIGNVQITSIGNFSNNGIRGKSFIGNIILQNNNLMSLKQGSIEFWFQPRGYNTLSNWGTGVLGGPFEFYLHFSGVPGYNPLNLYFQPANSKSLEWIWVGGEPIHDGKWNQVVITWRGTDIEVYIDGIKQGENIDNSLITPGNKGILTNLEFQGGGRNKNGSLHLYNQFDEIYLYNKALTPEEVSNAYYRYREPSKMKPVQFHPLNLKAQYFPSNNLIYYKFIPNESANNISKIVFVLRNSKGKELFSKQVPFSTKEETIKIPYLKSTAGYTYSLDLYVTETNGKTIKSDTFKFERRHFDWENNTLGITNRVYPPFTPIKINGNDVQVVLRKYGMNGFGLWDSVITEGKEILAGPITLNYTTKKGLGSWTSMRGEFTFHNDVKAIYKSKADAALMKIKTTSTIYFDGCMKVAMEILPSGVKQKINNIYIDIPLKASYVSLFHEITDGARINYSGILPEKKGTAWLKANDVFHWKGLPHPNYVPKGKGVIWDSTQAIWWTPWLDSFVPYIWLGGEKRGLAFFADNDKGWYTIKDGDKTPIEEIIRKGNAVILRIFLADHPVVLKHSTKLVFGLDVSPTKPMPKDWRLKLQYIPRGLPVNAWGGLDCAYNTPYKNHWGIVNKIEEARNRGNITNDIHQWFENFNKKYNPPPAYGNWPWLTSVEWFANDAVGKTPFHPITCYTEENDVSGVRKEWKTYLYEWTQSAYFYNQYNTKWPDYAMYYKGSSGSGEGVTWDKSARDYEVWIQNQWLKRGVGLYWDNFCYGTSYNYRTTPAYITKTGQIQPAATIWEMRSLIMRVWNLLGYWKEYWEKRGLPLEFVLHMTNTFVLPMDTFATADLDNELGPSVPIGPGYLRTETLGLQAGNYPLSLHHAYGDTNPWVKPLPDAEKAKIEWGMEMVHEIKRAPLWDQNYARLDKIVFGYGYVTKAVKIYHYWSRNPGLKVNSNKIKWIILSKPKNRSMMIILSSYSKDKLTTPIRINYNILGINNFTNITATNVLTGKQKNINNIILSAPYGVDILELKY